MGRIAGLSAAETRARLVDAASAVFAERGYEGARTSEIAKRAGFTTGAIYSQFGTKAELLLEAIKSFAPVEIDRFFAGEVDESESFADLLQTIGTGLPFRPRALGALLMEAITAAQRVPGVADTLVHAARERERFLADVVGAAQAAGDIDPTLSAAALARMGFTMTLGSLVANALDLEPPDADDWGAVVARLVASVRDQGTAATKE